MNDKNKYNIWYVLIWIVCTVLSLYISWGEEKMKWWSFGVLGYGLLLIIWQWKKARDVTWPFIGAVASMFLMVMNVPKNKPPEELYKVGEFTNAGVFLLFFVLFILIYGGNRKRW